jgi:hypothetical protein
MIIGKVILDLLVIALVLKERNFGQGGRLSFVTSSAGCNGVMIESLHNWSL